MTTVVFDLDSTLADTSPRHHLIDREDKENTDWEAYSLAAADDLPFEGTCILLRLLYHRGVHIVILTARSGIARDLTIEWLRKHDIPFDELVMRGDGEPGTPADFKIRELRRLDARGVGAGVALVIEDWPDVKAELEEAGYPVLLVNPNYPPFEQEEEVEAAEVGV